MKKALNKLIELIIEHNNDTKRENEQMRNTIDQLATKVANLEQTLMYMTTTLSSINEYEESNIQGEL